MNRKLSLTRPQIVLLITIIVAVVAALAIAGYYLARYQASARFELSDFQISAKQAVEGDLVYVYVNVTNVGGTNGTYSVLLLVDGLPDTHLKASPEALVMLAPSQTAKVSFVFTASEGTHLVRVGNFKETVTFLRKSS